MVRHYIKHLSSNFVTTINKMIRIIDNEDSDLINVLVIERRHNAVKLHSIVSQRSVSPST